MQSSLLLCTMLGLGLRLCFVILCNRVTKITLCKRVTTELYRVITLCKYLSENSLYSHSGLGRPSCRFLQRENFWEALGWWLFCLAPGVPPHPVSHSFNWYYWEVAPAEPVRTQLLTDQNSDNDSTSPPVSAFVKWGAYSICLIKLLWGVSE